MIRFLLLIAMLYGCGAESGLVYIEPEFVDHVAEFEDNLGIKVDTPVFYLEPSNPKHLAVCVDKAGFRYVVVSPSKTKHFSPAQFNLLMYHELGHCVLGLRHNDKVVKGKPASVMRSQFFTNNQMKYFIEDKEYYIWELREAWINKPYKDFY